MGTGSISYRTSRVSFLLLVLTVILHFLHGLSPESCSLLAIRKFPFTELRDGSAPLPGGTESMRLCTTMDTVNTMALDEEDLCLGGCLLLIVLGTLSRHFIFLRPSLQSVNEVAVRNE